MQARASAVSQSPSFNSYSNTGLAETAARVAGEFTAEENYEFYDEFYFDSEVDLESAKREVEIGIRDEDEGIEFEFVTRNSESSPISADEIFHKGQIRPFFPILKGDLLIGKVNLEIGDKEENGKKKIRLPLRRLLIEEREMAATTSSSSSSEADELEGVPEEMYCVWRPKPSSPSSEADAPKRVPEELYCVMKPKTPAATEPSEETAARCKKSSSTGSVYKKLKLKELLNRSHSEGRKENFVFLAPKSGSWRKRENDERIEEKSAVAGKKKPAAAQPRRTYLPYRRDLVGFFSNVNGFSKNLQPF